MTDPREQCLIDISRWTQAAWDRGEQVVLLMDTNQLLEEQMVNYNIGNLVNNCDLTSAINIKHPGASVNSTKTGSKMIDHILAANGTEATITKCGQLPFNLGFDTNHCAVYTDMQVTEIL